MALLNLIQVNAQIYTPNGNISGTTLNPSSGFMGIGTNSPSESVEIVGNVVFGAKKISPQAIDTKWIFHTRGDFKNLYIAPRHPDDLGWNWARQIRFDGDGNVFISGDLSLGSSAFFNSSTGNVSFQGKLETKEVKVAQTPTADFVFEEDYALPKLEDVEKHIKEKKHLPEIASAKEMEKDGVNIGEFQIKLLQKIEELTLYSIEQNKQIKKLKEEQSEKIKSLEEELKEIKSSLKK